MEYPPPQFEHVDAHAEQPHELELGLADLSAAVNSWLDAYVQATPEVKEELHEEYAGEVPLMLDILQQDNYSAVELEDYFDLLSRVEKASGIDWQAHVRSIPVERLYSHYQNSFSGLHTLLADGAEQVSKEASLPEERISFAATFYRASAGTSGQPLQWRNEHGQLAETLPEYMSPVVTDERFVATALSLTPDREPHETNKAFTNRIRWAEQILLERYTPIVGELSSRFRYSLDARTMKADANGMVIPMTEPEGGVDFKWWKERMEAVIDSTLGFTPDELQFLYEKQGLVNFDIFSSKQLDRTLKVLKGDEATIEFLKQRDVAVYGGEPYGSYNKAFDRLPSRVETDGLLVSEASKPSQAVRNIVRFAQKLGVPFSSLVIPYHGSDGTLHSGRDNTRFDFVSDEIFAKPDIPSVDISKIALIGSLIRKHMRPHSQTDERLITLVSCSQGKLLEDALNVPEAILSHTEPEDKLTVRAMPVPGNIRGVEGYENWFEFCTSLNGQGIQAREFRLSPEQGESDSIAFAYTDREFFQYV